MTPSTADELLAGRPAAAVREIARTPHLLVVLRLRRHAGADRRRPRRRPAARRDGRARSARSRRCPPPPLPSSPVVRCATSPRCRGCRPRSTSSAATAPSSTSASSTRSKIEQRALLDAAGRRDAATSSTASTGVTLERKPAGVAVHVRRADRARRSRGARSVYAGARVVAGRPRHRGQGGRSSSPSSRPTRARDRPAAPPGRRLGHVLRRRRRHRRSARSPCSPAPTSASRSATGDSLAAYRVAGPAEVAVLLALLAEERRAWLTGRRRHAHRGPRPARRRHATALMTPGGAVDLAVPPRARFAGACSPSCSADRAAGHFAVAPGARRPSRWPGLRRRHDDRAHAVGRARRHRLPRPQSPAGRRSTARHAPRARGLGHGARAGRLRAAPRLRPAAGAARGRASDGIKVVGAAEPIVLRAPGVEWEIHVDGQHETATGDRRSVATATSCSSCAAAPTTSADDRARRGRAASAHRGVLARVGGDARPAAPPRRDRAAFGADPQGAVPRHAPARSSPRPRRACPRASAASATGTTATAGSATAR